MYNNLIFSIHVIQLILLSQLEQLLLVVSSGCLDMRHELTNFRSERVNFASQIVVVINSLVQTKNWRCCTKPLIFSNIFLKRDQGVRFWNLLAKEWVFKVRPSRLPVYFFRPVEGISRRRYRELRVLS